MASLPNCLTKIWAGPEEFLQELNSPRKELHILKTTLMNESSQIYSIGTLVLIFFKVKIIFVVDAYEI